MNDFPQYPTDFIAMTTPFEDEDLENLMTQKIEDLVFTIDTLKKREVNASRKLDRIKIFIYTLLDKKKSELKNVDIFTANRISYLEDQIAILESILEA